MRDITINYEWLRSALEQGVEELLTHDHASKDEKIEALYQKLRHGFIEETKAMLGRIQKSMLLSVDREREIVE